MLAVVLGLLTSVSFSFADFFGGVASRRTDPWLVVLANQTIGLGPLLVYLVLLTDGGPTSHDVVLSLVAGIGSVAGLGLLFGAFAVGRMAVVAPVSAGVGGVVPILWGLLQGERPAAVGYLGAALTLGAAIVLARTEAPTADLDAPGECDDGKAAVMAIGAGLAFGTVIILFAETREAAGLWPAVIAHLVAIPTLALGLLLTGRSFVPPVEARRPMVGSGFFDATAVALLLVALRQDLVSLVAPAASLYPAGTVLLAALVLGERLHRIQVVALAVAILGLVLLALG